MSGSSSLVLLLSYLAPLLLVVAAAAWAWPLVSRNVAQRAGSPKKRWNEYFNGDRAADAPDAVEEATPDEPPARPARAAHLPQGVSESIYDE